MKDFDFRSLLAEQEGSLDTESLPLGHRERFEKRLNDFSITKDIKAKRKTWSSLWVAASAAVLIILTSVYFTSEENRTLENESEVSTQISNTQYYFAKKIEEEIKELKIKQTPETKKMVDDALIKLQDLNRDYERLEQDLSDGGNQKMILNAMIMNFQTRIALLQSVLDQINEIKYLNIKRNETSST